MYTAREYFQNRYIFQHRTMELHKDLKPKPSTAIDGIQHPTRYTAFYTWIRQLHINASAPARLPKAR